jgi:hypothetical protein
MKVALVAHRCHNASYGRATTTERATHFIQPSLTIDTASQVQEMTLPKRMRRQKALPMLIHEWTGFSLRDLSCNR